MFIMTQIQLADEKNLPPPPLYRNSHHDDQWWIQDPKLVGTNYKK